MHLSVCGESIQPEATMLIQQSAAKQVLNLLVTSRRPIFNQLLLEEALLRNTKQNWMVLNDGAFQPAIVMGISGKPEELINLPAAVQAGIQVIKRFTGGGTVVVDHDTVFTSLIFQGDALPAVECYPRPIMRWTEEFYQHAFHGMHVDGHGFGLRENDYVFGHLKFGGNAQSITGKRWLHHTSLLWQYDPRRMALLAQPRKAPDYRQGRGHSSFLVPLSQVQHSGDAMPQSSTEPQQQLCSTLSSNVVSRQAVLDRLVGTAYQLPGFTVQERSIQEASHALAGNSICGTRLVDLAAILQQQQTAGTAQHLQAAVAGS